MLLVKPGCRLGVGFGVRLQCEVTLCLREVTCVMPRQLVSVCLCLGHAVSAPVIVSLMQSLSCHVIFLAHAT